MVDISLPLVHIKAVHNPLFEPRCNMTMTDLLILEAAAVPEGAPAWIDQSRLDACACNERLQNE